MTLALETAQSENAILRKDLADTRALLQKRKERKKGKRVALKGRFVFTTQEILDIAKAAEAETASNKTKKKGNTKAKAKQVEDDDNEESEIASSDSDSDCITVAALRS